MQFLVWTTDKCQTAANMPEQSGSQTHGKLILAGVHNTDSLIVIILYFYDPYH